MSSPTVPLAPAARWQRLALFAGLLGLVVSAAGGVFFPAAFFRAYLAAYTFYVGLGLGALVILMIYHLTGGAWGYLLRRPLEAAARTLPLLAVLFTPIACDLPALYPWARPAEVAASERLRHKAVYLNEPFFWGRAAGYFVLWCLWVWLFTHWSRRQDRTGDPRIVGWGTRAAGLCLLTYGITVTFASVDWVMSLQPHFRSTIFGPLVASGHLVSAMALAILVFAAVADRPEVQQVLSRQALNDVGNMQFTFLVIWGYMVYFQFMLIWITDLPDEVIWYIPRSRNGWQWVALALLALHLALPFLLLLLRDVKQHLPSLTRVAGLILFMQLVFDYYQVLPAFPGQPVYEHWLDFFTPLGIGGVWLAAYLWQLQRFPLMALHDGNRDRAEHLHKLDEAEAAWEREIDND